MFSCLIICNYVDAQRQSIDLPAKNEKEETYSGGMLFLQGGGLIYDNPHQQIKDISYGFEVFCAYFFKHLCVGIYGGHKNELSYTRVELFLLANWLRRIFYRNESEKKQLPLFCLGMLGRRKH